MVPVVVSVRDEDLGWSSTMCFARLMQYGPSVWICILGTSHVMGGNSVIICRSLKKLLCPEEEISGWQLFLSARSTARHDPFTNRRCLSEPLPSSLPSWVVPERL